MEITYSLKSFKNLLECLKANRDEFVCDVNKDGINIIVVNNVNTTIFRSVIPKTAFKSFNVKENINFGLDVIDILKTVKKLKGDFISVTNVNDDGISFNCGNVNFTEHNIKNVRVPRLPNLDLKYEYRINSKELFNAIEIVDTKTDQVLFENNWLSGDSIKVHIADKIEVGKNDTDSCSKFETDLLLDYKTCFPRCVKTTTVKIDKDMPISISGHGDNDEYYEIMISPRIDD